MTEIITTDYSQNAPTFNSTMPLPRSHDGELAVRTTKFGHPSKKGSMIRWTELSATGEVLTRWAKLVKPKEKVPAIDVSEMSRELKSNAKYDIFHSKHRKKMDARISKIYMKMGVSYLAARCITEPSPEVDICSWAIDEQQRERILVNPYILMGRMPYARAILHREIMHRALARGRSNLGDLHLSRLVYDICANRIIAATPGGAMSKAWVNACCYLYPEESKKTVLALCNSSLDSRDLSILRGINPVYAEMWEKLYSTKDQQVTYLTPKKQIEKKKMVKNKLAFDIRDMNPDDMYFRLRSQLTEVDRRAMLRLRCDGGLNPFGLDEQKSKKPKSGKGEGEGTPNQRKMPNGSVVDMKTHVDNTPSETSAKAELAMRKSLIPKRLRRGLNWKSYSDCRTDFWEKFVKDPEDINDPQLERYAEKIHTDKVLRNVAGAISEVLENDSVSEPYPQILTEEGTMLAFLGLRPPVWPLYQNQKGMEGKKRIIVFFDLSPSMRNYFSHMMYMCDCFEGKADVVFARNDDGDAGVMTFAGSVRELDDKEIAEMRAGKIKMGASTSFNAMVEYCCEQIRTDDVDAIVTFTDGESGLSPDNVKMFNDSGKRMYNIYMQQDTKANIGKVISSSLDRLNGESYTVNVPKTDVEYSK